jgi:hypothetical protein
LAEASENLVRHAAERNVQADACGDFADGSLGRRRPRFRTMPAQEGAGFTVHLRFGDDGHEIVCSALLRSGFFL